jgi:tetratricopeptide (TPR) repeat protein
MQQVSQGFSFAGKVSHADFSRADDFSKPFHVEYDYEREKSGDWDNLRILPQLLPVGLGDVDEKDPPLTPIQLGSPHSEVDRATLTLPKGWYADLPPSIHSKSSFATLDKTYTFANGTLTTERRYTILQKTLPAAQWKEYHKWFKDSGLDGEPYIQLVAAGSTIKVPKTTSAASDPAAEALVRDGAQAAVRKDLTTAAEKLDQAKAINSKQAGLWAAYGTVAAQYGKMNEAIDDFHRELDLHPDELQVYSILASLQMAQQKPDDAIKTLHEALDRNPGNERTVNYLAEILNRRSEFAASEKVLRSGLDANPGNAEMQMNLGLVLLHEDKKPEGEALLLKILNSTEDPGQLNNTAYELADASLDLDLAEKASRRCLDLLDEASNKGETGAAALRRSELIVSAWDTLGWILFREAKLDEAEPWIHAAWRNSFSAETGYHLGVILQKQNHPTEALAQLELARMGSSGTNAAEVTKLINAAIAQLSPTKGAKHNSPSINLQDERTYKFPRGSLTATGQGWATVELALTPHGTTDLRILDGDESLQPLASTIQHLNLDLALPTQSHATLLRRGVLSCHANTNCELVLLSTSAALSQ